MPIDLSNVGPGSATARDINRNKRQRLAQARQRPVTGPGATGLGIGPEQGVIQHPSTGVWRFQVAPTAPHYQALASIPQDTRSWVERKMQNVDTMLFRDRLSGARAFYESKGSAFGFTQKDIQQMIRGGILSYGKGGNMSYPALTASANTQAINSFIRDNYTQKGNKWVRNPDSKKNLQISDNTIQYLTYGGLDASIPQSQYYSDYSSGNIVRDARSPAQWYDRLPKVGKGPNAKVDYSSMASSYAKDKEQQASWESKIVAKIAKEGGSALWDKISSGNYTAQDVQNLRQYMYSPNGEYGDAQEKFIQETLLNSQASSPERLLSEQSIQAITDLQAQNAKERAKAAKEADKQTQDMYDKNFNPSLPVDARFNNLITAITGVGAGPSGEDTVGQGAYITPAMIEDIMRPGVGTYVTDSKVTGGKRYVPAKATQFTQDQKIQLLQAIDYAAQKGYDIPGALKPYYEQMYKDVTGSAPKSVVEAAQAGLQSGQGGPAGLSPDLKTGALPGSPMMVVKALAPVAKSVSDYVNSTYLAPTPADQMHSNWDVAINGLKAIGRAGVGFMPGMYYAAQDPVGTVKAFGQDWWHKYQSWDNFIPAWKEDPLFPVLDLLTLVDGVGLAFKGGQVVSATSRLSRVERSGELAIPEVPLGTSGKGGVWLPSMPEPGVAAETTTKGVSRLEYAGLMRKIAAGDEFARIRLEQILPSGTRGSNSLHNPGAWDYAAGWFEPQWAWAAKEEGNPALKDKSRKPFTFGPDGNIIVDENVAGFRFSPNPITRAVTRTFFSAQMQGGRMSGRIANLPYLGFNYRYDKAMSESNLAAITATQQEFAMLNMYHKLIDSAKFDDVEMQVIMDSIAGGKYSPAMYVAIKKRLLQENAVGMSEAERLLHEQDIRRFEDPEYLKQYADRKAALMDGTSARGKEMSAARSMLTTLLNKQNRLLSGMDTPATIDSAVRAYSAHREAARLTARDFNSELGNDINNLVELNPNYHFVEHMKEFPEMYTAENGVFKPITNSSEVRQAVEDMRVLGQDQAFRNLGGHPFFIVDRIIRDAEGTPMFIEGRRLRFEGDITGDGVFERKPLIDSKSRIIPASMAVPASGAVKGVKTMSADKAMSQLLIGATNALHQIFPNVRDMTDKISDRSVNTTESFLSKQSRYVVTANAMQDYHFNVQFAAHEHYLAKRVEQDWQRFVEESAMPMLAGKLDPKQYLVTKATRYFDTLEQAQAYAKQWDSLGATQEGQVSERIINGETKYAVNMKYFDTMLNTVIEQRSGRLRTTADFEKDYIMNLDEVKALIKADPNMVLSVIPRPMFKNFKKSQNRIDRALHDTFVAKGFGLLGSTFKLLALSLNWAWIPQSVIGSSMMIGLAKPEMFPSIMAHVWTKAARNAIKFGKGKISKSEVDPFTHHADDYEYFKRIDPHAFDSVYMRDRTQDFMGRLGDNFIGKYVLGGGYLTVFAFESNLRAAMYREVAMRYPGFKSLMKDPRIKELAANGIPELGFESLSPFQAAFHAMSTPSMREFYDPAFMREVRYTTDGVLGNYRDFSHTEQAVRNYLIPFYAWQRHSALFTYRLFKERPLQLNAFYQLGNYGYERNTANGSTLPEWMYESVPLPSELVKFLDLNPAMVNRLNLASLNPFGTTTDLTLTLANYFGGQSLIGGAKSVFDMTNPFINSAISTSTGIDPRTGLPLSAEDKQKGLFENFAGVLTNMPIINQITSAFKNDIELNQMRGMDNPTDIFVNPNDPSSKLSIPSDKLTTKFNVTSPAGLFNAFSPVKAISLDPEQMVKNYKSVMGKRGTPVKGAFTTTALMRHTNALVEWKRKSDFVTRYWVPTFGKQYPEVAQRVMAELQREFPDLPKGYPPELYNQVMGGGAQ